MGKTFFKGGVIDRLDCLIVTGFFLLIYVNNLVYEGMGDQDRRSSVIEMVSQLTPESQQELYDRLKQELQATLGAF